MYSFFGIFFLNTRNVLFGVFLRVSMKGAVEKGLYYIVVAVTKWRTFDGIPFINVCGSGICGVRKTESRPLPVGPETPRRTLMSD